MGKKTRQKIMETEDWKNITSQLDLKKTEQNRKEKQTNLQVWLEKFNVSLSN